MTNVIKRKKGFTLTELIIVIAIIGILAAVLIPSLAGYITRANKSRAEQEASSVKTVYENWLTINSLTTTTAVGKETEFKIEYVDATGESINIADETMNKITLTETGFEYITKDGNWIVTYTKTTGNLVAVRND